MKKEAYFATAEELARGGLETIPPQMISGKHLIYSSPATLAAEEILLLSAPCRSTMIDFFI